MEQSRDWLASFLFIHTRQTKPDERPLYAYKCGDKKYAELKALIKGYLDSVARGKSIPHIAPLFCLYAAETFCREHMEGAWSWETVFHPLEMAVPDHARIRDWVEQGLNQWHRPLIRGNNGKRRFLTTIACEGGLPLRVLRKDDANLSRYFRAVLEGYHAHGLGGAEAAEAIARQQAPRLPPSLRQDVVFHLGGQLIAAVTDLQRQISGDSDPIAELDAKISKWRQQLPLRLEEKTAETLFGMLIRRSSELVRDAKSRIQWRSRLYQDTNGWLLEKLALCEIQWVIKFQFSTKEVDHVDEIIDIAIPSGSTFSELNLIIDPFKNAVRDTRFNEMNDSRPMRLYRMGEFYKSGNPGCCHLSTPLLQKSFCR